MANQFSHKQKLAIVFGCILVVCLLALPASGAGMGLQMVASGDRVFLNSEWTWIESGGDLSVLPEVSCGQEILSGAYSANILSREGKLQTVQSLQTDEGIMQFDSGLDLSGGKTVLMEHSSIYDVGIGACAGGECCENVSTPNYAEFAHTSAMFMGDALNYQSMSAITQGNPMNPDSMKVTVLGQGSGVISFGADGFSKVGIGNTSELGLENLMHSKVTTSGKNLETGMAFEFTSFMKPFRVIIPAGGEEETPEAAE